MSEKLNRTKILATMGPAVASAEQIEALVAAGVNGCRLNFSHGSYESMDELIGWVRAAAEKNGRPVALLQDLQGPKIRLGKIKDNYLEINEGDDIILDYAVKEHDGGLTLPVQYNLAEKVKVGEPVYIFDGKIRTHVQEIVSDTAIRLTAENKGFVNSNKGLNLPDTDFGGDVFTPKDIADLEWGATRDFDYIAISFVQSADDIYKLREMLKQNNYDAKIIAKIETKKAVADDATMEAIVKATDAIMVARGDMAYEVGAERVPIIQRKLLRLCREHGKICIVATQTMGSMVDSPVPTRAEVSDVANAVIQGADTVMLSEETAMGHYPLETVKTMKEVILYTQENCETTTIANGPEGENQDYDAIAGAAARLAEKIGADAIICETATGATAHSIAAERPNVPVISVTSNPHVANQLALIYANAAFVRPYSETYGVDLAKELKNSGYLQPKDGKTELLTVVVSGNGQVAGTDTIKVRRI